MAAFARLHSLPAAVPGIRSGGLTGAVRYFDGATNDARLVLSTPFDPLSTMGRQSPATRLSLTADATSADGHAGLSIGRRVRNIRSTPAAGICLCYHLPGDFAWSATLPCEIKA